MAEAQERISSAEYTEWLAYYQIEPWGDERADLRNGILCALTANMHRSKGRKFKAGDFMPKFGKDKRAATQSVDDARRVMMSLTHQAKEFFGARK